MNQLKIAFLPQQRLGDGIIALVLANNLYQNNYAITVFHGFIQQIDNWFDYDIEAYPEHNKLEEKIKDFDIVLMDRSIPFVLSKTEKQQEELSKKYIFFAVGRIQENFIHEHTERLIKRLGNERRSMLEHIANASRMIKFAKKDSMIDNMFKYCQETLQLQQVSKQTGIKIPTHIQYGKYNRRVVISPTSSLEKKNWGAEKFILLARLLKEKGYEPIFAVAMNERKEWQLIINNEFDLPEFNTIKIYAEYLYQSLGFIGNDSGGGHVASLMGVPVLTIVTSPKKLNFRWRPGWGENAVVAPRFTFKFRGKRYWHQFLSAKKVYREFEQLIESH